MKQPKPIKIISLNALIARVKKLEQQMAQITGTGYVCVMCHRACPKEDYWYDAYNQDIERHESPACADCVRSLFGKTYQVAGPFRQPVVITTIKE